MKARSAGSMGLLVMSLGLCGCTPNIEDCRAVLPVAGEVSVVTTPTGQPGCSCVTEGVTVVVQPVRKGLFGWKRGAIWVEGTPTSEAEFPSRLENARLQKRVEDATTHVMSAAQVALEKAAAATRGLVDGLTR